MNGSEEEEKEKENEDNLYGFTETLKKRSQTNIIQINKDVCNPIFMNGSKVTKKYFYPSEFPKLTKIKPITVSMRGGRRKRKTKTKKNRK